LNLHEDTSSRHGNDCDEDGGICNDLAHGDAIGDIDGGKGRKYYWVAYFFWVGIFVDMILF
jgi:hypothetical protein